jgi:hypothetical protein
VRLRRTLPTPTSEKTPSTTIRATPVGIYIYRLSDPSLIRRHGGLLCRHLFDLDDSATERADAENRWTVSEASGAFHYEVLELEDEGWVSGSEADRLRVGSLAERLLREKSRAVARATRDEIGDLFPRKLTTAIVRKAAVGSAAGERWMVILRANLRTGMTSPQPSSAPVSGGDVRLRLRGRKVESITSFWRPRRSGGLEIAGIVAPPSEAYAIEYVTESSNQPQSLLAPYHVGAAGHSHSGDGEDTLPPLVPASDRSLVVDIVREDQANAVVLQGVARGGIGPIYYSWFAWSLLGSAPVVGKGSRLELNSGVYNAVVEARDSRGAVVRKEELIYARTRPIGTA